MSRIRIVQGKIFESIGEDFTYYSESHINEYSDEYHSEKSEKLIKKDGNPSKPPAGEITAKCLIQFRPHNNWHGEYGFDWVRVGDTGQAGDKKWYRDIMGNYTYPKTKYGFDYCNPTFHNKTSEYDRLVTSEFRKMIVSWKKNGRYPFYYVVPYLSLLPSYTAKLQLKIEIEEEPEKFEVEYHTDYFTVKILKPLPLSVGKHTVDQCLDITCTNEFISDQEIIIKAYKNGEGKDVGKLIVVKNSTSNQREIKVTLVSIIKGKEKPNLSVETNFLEKILRQSYIIPTFQYSSISINPKVDLGKYFLQNTDTYDILNKKLRDKVNLHGAKNNGFFDDSFRLFFSTDICEDFSCNEKGFLLGQVEYIPDKKILKSAVLPSVIIFDQKKFALKRPEAAHLAKSTAMHELLHAMGLHHTFDEKSKYGFKQFETDNIMDYSDSETNITAKQTYRWQWQILKNILP
ncbi:zinc metalloprotease [Chryseobacterium caseinilyticum]|uniref:Peptidase M10 metallopeptidase domain-containing protein n=1 Tax=Chryseobacterium caseinilyticum TaxID=2771428 RepID=A0ABR8ZA58_9FLAO|nr:hypothetical protein [Chryseobacterium caseinilyticum]MBD8082193.1 hypothetical protein [Chryseobacterium caseinilyticum]